MRPIAGIIDARRIAFGVKENARRLHRYAYVEQRLLVAFAGHLVGTSEWEVKYALGRHLWEDSEHATWLRERVTQLRTSEGAIDHAPDGRLALLMDEALEARDTVELLAGYYGVIKTRLLAAYRRHLAETQPLVDFPTVRLLKFIIAEEEEQLVWANEALAELTEDSEARARAVAWQAQLERYLSAAGGVVGDEPGPAEMSPPDRSRVPAKLPKLPARDSRFALCGEFLDSGYARANTAERSILMARVRLNEMAAVENIASTLYQTTGMPWDYYHDLARHLWDEVRHSCFGQVWLEQAGRRVDEFPMRMSITDFYTTLTPLERYVLLGIAIENGAMKYPPGKRLEYEWCRDVANDALPTVFQDYDWADEVLHAQIARRWVSAQLSPNRRVMQAEADRLRDALNAAKPQWTAEERYADLAAASPLADDARPGQPVGANDE
ncbi:MAG TPA: hypothetical protein VNG11_07390 [Chloroflexota bacterium]|nr:hypothetical protein [Chloroflexota bacterium]